MYSIFKQVHPVTGAEHCTYCHFFSWRERNLVMAVANQLKVYRLVPETDKKREELKGKDSKVPKMKLECMASFTLFGTIMSIEPVMLAGSKRESLLVGFLDAKLSVLEYDPNTHDMKTLSLHYFEDDDVRGGWTNHHHIPLVRVDPEGRCAAMLIYGRKIVVLPFCRDSSADETESARARSPILSSYTINLKDLDEKMDSIIDVRFLYGYYEPTLLILYEPLKTYAGRVAVRQDMCALVAISLNVQQKVHPIIWSVSSLPFDCTQALAVPKPIGGTIVFSVNAMLYLNQSVPPYGVSLNSIAEATTNFPLKTQDGVSLSLDGAQATFITSDRIVMSLKTGELYVITLFADSMRTVRNFIFDKAASSVLTSCMCLCESNYLFLGSRLGNSLLLRFLEKEQNRELDQKEEGDDSPKATTSEPPSKKKRFNTLGDWMASDVADIKDAELELEVYGNDADQTSILIKSYVFEACDSLMNIGPCGNVSMGEPAFLSEEFANLVDPDLELVTTSGFGKNGALCVLQRSLRPQIVTTFELPGCVDMWTVVGNTAAEETEDGVLMNSHAFMILSRLDSSLILHTAEEINEVDNSGFSTQSPTIFAGNLGNNKYIVQVNRMGVRLLQGVDLVQHIPFDLGSPIYKASASDPYVVLLTEDGQMILLTLKMSGKLVITRPQILQKSRVITLCVYRDVSGMFTTVAPEDGSYQATFQEAKPEKKEEMDDEDEMLYGDSDTHVYETMPTPKSKETTSENKQWWHKYFQEVRPTYWLALVRENSNFELYGLPDFQLSYVVRNFSLGYGTLVDCIGASSTLPASVGNEPHPIVEELLLVGLGHNGHRPLLLARTEDELLLYEAFPFYETQAGDQLKLRFRRIPHGLILRERRSSRQRKKPAGDSDTTVKPLQPAQLHYFTNISGYSGVFISGPYPHWLLMTSRGELRMHPMGIDGAILCFAAFHNVNCPQGFLYFNKKDEMRICVLPNHLSYDAPWPVRKVPLRCTPYFVTYHLESKTYCLVTSSMESSNCIYKFNGEDKELCVEERDERFPLPVQERFTVQIFSPVSWEVIPNTKMELEEWEHVTCMKNVSLACEGTRSGLKGYIAIGTNYNFGEDITSRGRILILDIIEVVPEPGQPLTKNKFKTLYAKEQKGPVTALCHCMGFLVSAVGQKIYIWQLKDRDLIGIAFIDTQIYIHQMYSIKNLILVADVCKSVSLLSFQESFRTLSLVSRDYRPLEAYSVEYLIDNSQMGFLVSDMERNLLLYMYQPDSRESFGGQRLLRKADFHVGQHINSFFRIRCKLTDPSIERKHSPVLEKRHITMMATLDGGFAYLLPLPEKNYRRLLMLQNVLITQVPHIAGLNPKAFRTFRANCQQLANPSRSIIDGELVWMYLNLSLPERVEVAKKIGTKPDEIVEDLLEVDRVTAHF